MVNWIITTANGKSIPVSPLSKQRASERTDAVEALKSEIEHRVFVEEAVRANELRTRMIIESSYDAFVAIDSNGIIVDWNQQAEATFGWTRQESVGADPG